MSQVSFEFRGREIVTIRDVSSAIAALYEEKDVEGSKEFMDAFRQASEDADDSVGYLCGYFGDLEGMTNFFDVDHPVFGRKSPTVEEALQAGMEIGARMRNER